MLLSCCHPLQNFFLLLIFFQCHCWGSQFFTHYHNIVRNKESEIYFIQTHFLVNPAKMLLSTGKLCLNFLVPAQLLSHTCTFESKKLLANLLQCLTPILNNKQTCFFLPDFLSTLAHLTALFSLVNDKHPIQFSVALIRPTTMATYRRKIWGLWSQRDKRPSPSWQGNAATNSMHSDRNS